MRLQLILTRFVESFTAENVPEREMPTTFDYLEQEFPHLPLRTRPNGQPTLQPHSFDPPVRLLPGLAAHHLHARWTAR